MKNDRRFEMPAGWKGARFLPTSTFGTALVRPHPDGAFVIRFLEGADETAPGIWSAETGKLVQFFPHALDAQWLPDGKSLLVVTVPGEVRLAMLSWPGLAVEREAELPFSTDFGVGGLELTTTASGTRGAIWIYSGQSEEGFILFSLPELRSLACMPYVPGESASPCLFSPDERYLALLMEHGLWWEADEDQVDAVAHAMPRRAHWATLYLQEVSERGRCTEHRIMVDLPKGWTPDEDLEGATWPMNARFKDSNHFTFETRWGGECIVSIPPEGDFIAPPPA